ncbi:PREDICTED: prokineticin-2-like [Branchiostoma belcheri]|uniref:Prokineticin-2-like n=1 Tax=Branchiostoma belcheri TaxID=7741 RepID=A0A6P4ZZZ0_BRABE|nr:PREDICTED: prokineticin-2-like [Branchiostoma belcheri]
MDMLPKLLLAAACLLASARFCHGLVLTGACDSDHDCTSGCCARWNPSSNLAVCKPLGQEGQLCHTASNSMPFPFSGVRRFWRCPCEEGLTCERSEGNIGHCRQPATTAVPGDQKRAWEPEGPVRGPEGAAWKPEGAAWKPEGTAWKPEVLAWKPDGPAQTLSPEELLEWIEAEKALMDMEMQ